LANDTLFLTKKAVTWLKIRQLGKFGKVKQG